MELSTDRKGAIAEACISAAAIKLGIGVYRPLSEGGRYDLIFDVDGMLARVQCKWGVRSDDVIVVRCYSARRTLNDMLNRRYTTDEIDLVAAYCEVVDRSFILPPALFGGVARCTSGSGLLGTTNGRASTGRRTTRWSGYDSSLRGP